MSRAEFAVQQLYEDSSVRDELLDDDAQLLLTWAETEVVRLDAEAADDEQFSAAADALRRLLTQINRFVGRRASGAPDEQRARFDKIAALAASIGHPLPPGAIASFGSAQAEAGDAGLITALTGLISGGLGAESLTAVPAPEPMPLAAPQAADLPAAPLGPPGSRWDERLPSAPTGTHLVSQPDAPADDSPANTMGSHVHGKQYTIDP